jgi:hypothetical protein
MARIIRNETYTAPEMRVTASDRARMAAAVAKAERLAAAKRSRERLARLAVICIAVGLAVALFYAGTN